MVSASATPVLNLAHPVGGSSLNQSRPLDACSNRIERRKAGVCDEHRADAVARQVAELDVERAASTPHDYHERAQVGGRRVRQRATAVEQRRRFRRLCKRPDLRVLQAEGIRRVVWLTTRQSQHEQRVCETLTIGSRSPLETDAL